MGRMHAHSWSLRMRRAILCVAVTAQALVLLASCYAPPSASADSADTCQPGACRPPTRGQVTVRGKIIRAREEESGGKRAFDIADVRFTYRTVEPPPADSTNLELGSPRSVKVSSHGEFAVSLAACGPEGRFFGCVGGTYSANATYDGQTCSESFFLNAFDAEVYDAEEASKVYALGTLECSLPKGAEAKIKIKRRRK